MEPSVSTTPPENTAAEIGSDRPATASVPDVRPWRLNALRAGYLFVVAGTAATQWPTLLSHDPAWPLMDGVKTSMLAAVSILAPVGLRYPLQMLPVLLFEVAWKVVWAAAVAWPLCRPAGPGNSAGGVGLLMGSGRSRRHPLALRARPVRGQARRAVAIVMMPMRLGVEGA